MSKEDNIAKMKEFVTSAWQNMAGTPIIIYTADYVYGLKPADATKAKWKEMSLDLHEFQLDEKELDPGVALQLLIEELVKSLPGYATDLPFVKSEAEVGKVLEKLK